MNKQIIAEDGNIRLVPLDPQEDAGVLTAWVSSSSMRHQNLSTITNPCVAVDESGILTDAIGQPAEWLAEYHFAVREGELRPMIGLVHLGHLVSTHHAAWLEIEIEEEAAVKEKAGVVIDLALQFAFVDLELHRVCVNIPSYDDAEIALYEEAGFLRETQRRQAVCHEGRLFDDLLYGILRSEWLKLQQEVEA